MNSINVSDNVRRFVKEFHGFDPQSMLLVDSMLPNIRVREIINNMISGKYIVLGNCIILENPYDAVTIQLLPIQETK